MEMDERKLKILQAIIDDYILTGVPVGSRTISKKADMGLSSATIRNEMSDLEELGYLDQPHVSAGRIPSAKAYRLYVDSLMKAGRIRDDSLETVSRHFSGRVHQMEDVIDHAASVISALHSGGAFPEGKTAQAADGAAGTGCAGRRAGGDRDRHRHRPGQHNPPEQRSGQRHAVRHFPGNYGSCAGTHSCGGMRDPA